jgi:hypothetical protein
VFVFFTGVDVASSSNDPRWRAWRLENLRRSFVMLRPDQVAGLRREEAIHLIEELQAVQGRLDRLRSALRLLVEEDA